MDNMCELAGSKEGMVVNEKKGIRKRIKWSSIGGTVVICGGLFAFVSNIVKESKDFKKLEISSDYPNYVDQIENTFDIDLPYYLEGYINKYGEILDKINSYNELSLKEQYNLRNALVDDAVFVEDSSLVLLKDVGYSKYGGNRSEMLIRFDDNKSINQAILLDGSEKYVLHGDMKDVAYSIYDLQSWKDENTQNYIDDWKSVDVFYEFIDDIKGVIINTAYMMKNYVDEFEYSDDNLAFTGVDYINNQNNIKSK